MKILDGSYDKAIKGIPHVSPSVEKIATEYMRKHQTIERACKSMIKNQIIKCTTSGFLTGFGAVIGGGFDLVETKIIGDRAYKWFFEGDYIYDEKSEEAANINVEDTNFEAEKIEE